MSANNRVNLSLLISCAIVLATFVVSVFGQASPEAPDPSSYGMTSGRLVATMAAVVALIGVVIGGLSVAKHRGGSGAIVALVAGLIGVAVGGLRVVTAGGIGTGGGRAGAIVALVLGLIAVALGGAALARSRQTE